MWLDHYDARAGSGGVDVCGGPTPERRMRIPVTATVPHNARCALSHFPRTHRYTTSSTQSRSDALLHPLTVPSTSASAARFSPRRVAPAVRPRGLWTMWKYTRDDARAAGKRNGTRAARNSEMSPSCPPTCEVVYISGHAGYEDSLKALTLFLTLRRSRRRHTPHLSSSVKSKTKTKQCCPQSCMSGLEKHPKRVSAHWLARTCKLRGSGVQIRARPPRDELRDHA